MEKIANYTTYNRAMKATLNDKLWFLKETKNIDTIIDFGCADGSLMVEIEKHHPNRYNYIGIDIDDVMISSAMRHTSHFADRTTFAHTIDAAASMIQLHNCVLVLNSVVHEICSYLTYIDRCELFNQFSKVGVKYIAIRDMHYFEKDEWNGQMQSFDWHKHQEQYQSWNDKHYYPDSDINKEIEFMLKYRYANNWMRECAERYLWDWSTIFHSYFTNEEIQIETDFYIPFIFNTLNRDYDTNITPFPTHKKMLIKLKNFHKRG